MSESVELFQAYCSQLRVLYVQQIPVLTKAVIKLLLSEAHIHAAPLKANIAQDTFQKALLSRYGRRMGFAQNELSTQHDFQLGQAQTIGPIIALAIAESDVPKFLETIDLLRHTSLGVQAEVGLIFLAYYDGAPTVIKECQQTSEMFDWLSQCYESDEADFHQRMMGKLLTGLLMAKADAANYFPDHYQRAIREFDALLAMDGLHTYEILPAFTTISNEYQSEKIRQEIMAEVMPEIANEVRASKTLAAAIKLARGRCAKLAGSLAS